MKADWDSLVEGVEAPRTEPTADTFTHFPQVLSLLDELDQPVGGHGGAATDVWPTALPPAWPADAALFAPPPLPRAPWHSSKVVPLPPPGAGGWDASVHPVGSDVPMVDSIPMEPIGGVGPCLPGAPAALHRMAPPAGGMYPPRMAMAMLPHIRTHTIPPPPLPALHHPDGGAAAQPKGKGRKGAAARSAGAPRSAGGRSSMSDGGNGAASAPAPRTSHGAFGGGWTPDATAVSAGGPFSSGGCSLGRTTLSGGDDEDPDVKRERRILANRASAARSRQRKLEHVQELERNVATLQTQLEDAKRRFASTVAARDALLAHNEALRARALRLAEECGPGFTWTL